MSTAALGRLDDGTLVRAAMNVRYPSHVPAKLQGPAFDEVSAILRKPYAQLAPAGMPQRPGGAPRAFAAGDHATLWRAEFLALRDLGAARLALDRSASLIVLDENGHRVKITVGDLLDALTDAIAKAIIELWKDSPPPGLVCVADLEAREGRVRDVARLTPSEDRLKVVQS